MTLFSIIKNDTEFQGASNATILSQVNHTEEADGKPPIVIYNKLSFEIC
jgi:hypothetical protein